MVHFLLDLSIRTVVKQLQYRYQSPDLWLRVPTVQMVYVPGFYCTIKVQKPLKNNICAKPFVFIKFNLLNLRIFALSRLILAWFLTFQSRVHRPLIMFTLTLIFIFVDKIFFFLEVPKSFWLVVGNENLVFVIDKEFLDFFEFFLQILPLMFCLLYQFLIFKGLKFIFSPKDKGMEKGR